MQNMLGQTADADKVFLVCRWWLINVRSKQTSSNQHDIGPNVKLLLNARSQINAGVF